jgi:hypothetical protein
MSIFHNQTFKKKVQYLKSDDYDKSVSFSISVQTNHELDRNALSSIEQMIDNFFLTNYDNVESLKEKADLLDEEMRQEKEQEKEAIRQEKERIKTEKQADKDEKLYQKQKMKEKAEYKKGNKPSKR